MLDLNVDRMLFAVGVLIMGSAMIFAFVKGGPEVMDLWGLSTIESVQGVDMATSTVVDIPNSTFEEYSNGWEFDAGQVVFDGETAYLPSNTKIAMKLDEPTGSQLRVNFKARGLGSVRVQMAGNVADSNFSDIRLYNEDYTYTATIVKSANRGNKLEFIVGNNSEMIIDSVEVTNMGLVE